MELKDIYAKLEATEGGADMVAALKSEFKKRNDEAATHRTAKNKVLESLGLTETDDTESALSELAALKKSGVKTDEVTKIKTDLEKLKTQLKASEEAKAAERQKRIDAMRMTAALTALKDKAVRPEDVSKLILAQIKAKDDDALVFVDGEAEIDIEAGVNKWLESRPEFMRAKQQPGSGTQGQSAPNKVNPFAKESLNLTEQGKLIKSDPATAKLLAAEAGLTLKI